MQPPQNSRTWWQANQARGPNLFSTAGASLYTQGLSLYLSELTWQSLAHVYASFLEEEWRHSLPGGEFDRPGRIHKQHARHMPDSSWNLAKFAHGHVDTNILTFLRHWPCQNGQRVPCSSDNCNARPNLANTAEVLPLLSCRMTSSNNRSRLHRFAQVPAGKLSTSCLLCWLVKSMYSFIFRYNKIIIINIYIIYYIYNTIYIRIVVCRFRFGEFETAWQRPQHLQVGIGLASHEPRPVSGHTLEILNHGNDKILDAMVQQRSNNLKEASGTAISFALTVNR